ncbi:hypothetical protein [Aeromicrobium sp. Leaf350]|uniref:hypothetical protein n=1 Tax=Aeromicrobium sp. Leaf350 TaxID=2876565 RepID=UPI001E62EFC4|nr:hypothetical protein [Aeromicrobium sp. Leaf350]
MRWPLTALVTTVLAGVAGAVAWSQIADPARWTVAEQGLQMDQVAVAAQFGVTLTFVFVAVVGGLVLGFLLGVLARPVSWPLVPIAAVAGVVATLISWQLGLLWGPPDPSSVTGLAQGDTVPDVLALTFPAAFLAWPIATIAGLLPGVALNPAARAEAKDDELRWQAAVSAADARHDPFGEGDQVRR